MGLPLQSTVGVAFMVLTGWTWTVPFSVVSSLILELISDIPFLTRKVQ